MASSISNSNLFSFILFSLLCTVCISIEGEIYMPKHSMKIGSNSDFVDSPL